MKNPPISNEELFRRFRNGDSSARDDLILSNKRFVLFVAKRFHEIHKKSFNIEDFFQSGILGLMRAIESYDPNHDPRKEIKFTTYAMYWICCAIRREIRTSGKMARDANSINQFCCVNPEEIIPDTAGKNDFDQDEIEKLARLMNRLKPRDREVLRRWSSGESLKTIGKSLGFSKTAAQNIRNRAVERLRRLW